MTGRGAFGSNLPAGRARTVQQAPPPPRPDAELVWYHATTAAHAEMAPQLAGRLARARPGLWVLLTGTPETLADAGQPDGVILCPMDGDDGAAGRQFLAHWRPDLCIWTAGALKPALLAAASRQGIPLILVDADEAQLPAAGWRFMPSVTRAALRRFRLIMARTPQTEAVLRRRMRLGDAAITVTGPLQVASRPLPYNRSDREELAGLLRARPVWLAAHLHPGEAAIVLEANAGIARASHRTLLVMAPERPEQSGPFHDALRASGLRYLTWSEGALPDEATQVVLADTPGELGLWYRVAPISFLGGSLVPGVGGSDPNEPAAHGSAILYGPDIRAHLATYARFAEAGAARIVRDAPTLAAAVQRLIPPDQAAAMAHAAWDVATQSALVMDRLVDAVQGALDAPGAG